MGEKKLTDEEIVKAFEICYLGMTNCDDCPYEINNVDCTKRRSEKDILDFIHRLQDENKRLTEEKAGYEDLKLFNLAMLNGELDMTISGEYAKAFFNAIVEIFDQNGAKNYFTTTVDIEGRKGRYAFTIEKVGGQTVAEKLAEQKAEIERLTSLKEKDTAKEILVPLIGCEKQIDPLKTGIRWSVLKGFCKRFGVEVE